MTNNLAPDLDRTDSSTRAVDEAYFKANHAVASATADHKQLLEHHLSDTKAADSPASRGQLQGCVMG